MWRMYVLLANDGRWLATGRSENDDASLIYSWEALVTFSTVPPTLVLQQAQVVLAA